MERRGHEAASSSFDDSSDRTCRVSYRRQLGVELSAPFTLHTFRKSFGQNHADAGTPPRTLAKLLGHANTRVTLEFYNRVTDANERAAAEAMDRLFDPTRTCKDVV